MLRDFHVDLIGYTVLGEPRKEMADLHWVLALSMILLILAHFVLHCGWAKVSFKRRLRVGPTALAASAIILVLISMIVAPIFLTKDLPKRKEVKVTYQKQAPSPEMGSWLNKVADK